MPKRGDVAAMEASLRKRSRRVVREAARFDQRMLRFQAHPHQKIFFAVRTGAEKPENSGANDN
jgi:hypothetical protein